jgi:CRP-like cAMP-binding protein
MGEALREQIEKIVSLTDNEFEKVLSHFNLKHFSKHQFILQADSLVMSNYFIIKGLIKSFYVDEAGKEHILNFAMDNYWITDLEAFQYRKEARLNIYCIENCKTLSITYDRLEALCDNMPKMQYYFRKKADYDQALLNKRILCLITNNATDRYHDLMVHSPELVNRVPKTMIASYLGVSRETLSRMILQRM